MALRHVDWRNFVDWVKTTLDHDVLRALGHARVRQEFMETGDRFGGVSLLLFKGDDMLASIQKISPEKLEWLGWKRNGLWQSYSVSVPEIFKVQMDGEVVGIWTADGDINWDPSFSQD